MDVDVVKDLFMKAAKFYMFCHGKIRTQRLSNQPFFIVITTAFLMRFFVIIRMYLCDEPSKPGKVRSTMFSEKKQNTLLRRKRLLLEKRRHEYRTVSSNEFNLEGK